MSTEGFASVGQVAAAAKERAIRTLFQGLAVDVGIAVLLVLATVTWDDLTTAQAWTALGVTLGKTAAQSIISYLLRKARPPKQEVALAA
jgi:hypothetical protein